jgi:hypothetical protein
VTIVEPQKAQLRGIAGGCPPAPTVLNVHLMAAQSGNGAMIDGKNSSHKDRENGDRDGPKIPARVQFKEMVPRGGIEPPTLRFSEAV